MNIKCGICVAGLKLEITSLTNQLWRFHIAGFVCEWVCVRACIYVSSLVSSGNREPLHTQTHTQPNHRYHWSCCESECLFSASAGPSTPSPHTLAQMLPYTLALLYSLPPTSHLKRGPEIAQEAIRKNRARGGGGSSRGLQSKAIQGYTPESLSPPCHPSSSFALSASLCSDESVL